MEFQMTEVPRDRQWFADYLPLMRSFKESWASLAAKDNVRELLVRKRAVPVKKDPAEALNSLAKRPCRFALAVAQDEGDECLVAEAPLGEEGVPLLAALVQDALVQGP